MEHQWEFLRKHEVKHDFGPLCQASLKERIHSEMKIFDQIKFSSNIVPFAFIFSKNVSLPSALNNSQKISLPGPALSLPGTCIITSRELHYCFRGPAFSLPGPAILLSDLHYHFQDLHYCFRTCIIFSSLFHPDKNQFFSVKLHHLPLVL